jgi:hypothetical protein
MEHVFHITETGQIETLYTEDLPLFALGAATITRASEIEYNNDRKLWQVKIDRSIVFEDSSRASCLQWEHTAINTKLLAK